MQAQVLEQPVTSLLTLLMVAIWYKAQQRCLGYAALGQSYHAVVARKEWWRCMTSTFSHVELLHIAANMLSLLELGGLVERRRGALYLLHGTTLLCLLAALVRQACMCWVLVCSGCWCPEVSAVGGRLVWAVHVDCIADWALLAALLAVVEHCLHVGWVHAPCCDRSMCCGCCTAKLSP